METPYRAVSFATDDTITREYVEQVSNNLQWLHDHTPRSRIIIDRDDVRTVLDTRMVILSGQLDVGHSRNESTVKRKVYFGNVFAPDSLPNVTTGIVSQGAGNIFCVVNGIDRPYPDAKGCEILISAPDADGKLPEKKGEWEIGKPIFINWQAFGFRAVDEYGL